MKRIKREQSEQLLVALINFNSSKKKIACTLEILISFVLHDDHPSICSIQPQWTTANQKRSFPDRADRCSQWKKIECNTWWCNSHKDSLRRIQGDVYTDWRLIIVMWWSLMSMSVDLNRFSSSSMNLRKEKRSFHYWMSGMLRAVKIVDRVDKKSRTSRTNRHRGCESRGVQCWFFHSVVRSVIINDDPLHSWCLWWRDPIRIW